MSRRPVVRRLGAVARVLGLALSIGGLLIVAIVVVLRITDRSSSANAASISTGCSASATPLPIVVLGDSFTNGLDVMLEAVLCHTGIAGNAQVSTLSAGGEKLADHYADGDSDKFAGNSIVILQDQSEVPGLGRGYPDYNAATLAVDELGSAATQAGARVVLFQTWGDRDGDDTDGLASIFPDYQSMQDRLVNGYASYLSELRAGPAPTASVAAVGQAWQWIKDP